MVATAALVIPAAASASPVDPISVAVSYSQSPVNPGASETIEYTVKSTDTAATDAVDFTDTLPTGVKLDALPYETWTGCGINDDDNLAGAGAVTVTNATVTPETNCTITLSIDVANSVANGTTLTDAVTGLDWTPASGTVTQPTDEASDITDGSVLVVSNATITTTGVTAGAKYAWGKLVPFTWAATPATDDLIDSDTAFDDFGDTVNSGVDIDTLTPGNHYVEVLAETDDGGTATKTIKYTVEGATLTSVKSYKKGYATFKIALPFKGKLVSQLVHSGTIVGTTKTTITGKKTANVKVVLTAKGKTLLKKAGKKGLSLTVKSTFTPSGVSTGWPTAATAPGYFGTPVSAKSTIKIK